MTESDNRPGMLRRAAQRSTSIVRRGGRWWLRTTMGDLTEIRRSHAHLKEGLQRMVHPELYARREQFEDAVARLGLTDEDIVERSRALGRAARAYWAAAAVAFGFLCYTPFSSRPVSQGILSGLVLGVALSRVSVARWRQAQCDRRTLMPYLDYWRGWWRGGTGDGV